MAKEWKCPDLDVCPLICDTVYDFIKDRPIRRINIELLMEDVLDKLSDKEWEIYRSTEFFKEQLLPNLINVEIELAKKLVILHRFKVVMTPAVVSKWEDTYPVQFLLHNKTLLEPTLRCVIFTCQTTAEDVSMLNYVHDAFENGRVTEGSDLNLDFWSGFCSSTTTTRAAATVNTHWHELIMRDLWRAPISVAKIIYLYKHLKIVVKATEFLEKHWYATIELNKNNIIKKVIFKTHFGLKRKNNTIAVRDYENGSTESRGSEVDEPVAKQPRTDDDVMIGEIDSSIEMFPEVKETRYETADRLEQEKQKEKSLEESDIQELITEDDNPSVPLPHPDRRRSPSQQWPSFIPF